MFKKKVKRPPERVKLWVSGITEELIKQSNGELSREDAENLAYRCVAKIDFNNKYQMHVSWAHWAECILEARENKL